MRARLAIFQQFSAISNITCFSIERKSEFLSTHHESIVKVSTSIETTTPLLTYKSAHRSEICLGCLKKPSKFIWSRALVSKWPTSSQKCVSYQVRPHVSPTDLALSQSVKKTSPLYLMPASTVSVVAKTCGHNCT